MKIQTGSASAVFASFAAVSFAAVSFATPAHADNTAFLQEVNQQYKVFINLSNNQLLQLGYAACEAISAGLKGAQRDQAVAYFGTGKMGLPMVDEATAHNIATAAARNLC